MATICRTPNRRGARRFRPGDPHRRLQRRNRHRVLHEPPAHDEGEHDRDQEERREDCELPGVEQHGERQPPALVNQQRDNRSRHEAEEAAAKPAERHADEQRPSHQAPRDAAQPHEAERAALVQHQQAGEVGREHPRHPEQRQRDEQ
jgi:hypothetical protein